VARAIDTDAKNLSEVLRAAAKHTGSAFCEIYQNCNVFNDGAFETFRAKENKSTHQLHVEHGKPLIYGDGKYGLRFSSQLCNMEKVTLGEPDANGKLIEESDLLVHDETNHLLASALAALPFPEFPVVLGVLYRKERPTYDQTMVDQLEAQKRKKRSLNDLLRSGATWTVS
jgi:2-oxoglutarate ferredoxin oxidoreductase subunit beta